MVVYGNISLGTSICSMLGSLVGMTYKWVNRQLSISIFTLIMAASTICIPFLSHIVLQCAGQGIQGMGLMVWFTGVNMWLVEMWPETSAPVLQAGQFMYGLGSVISPLLASHFVFGEANVTADNQTLTVELRRKYLAIPYGITGSLQAVAPLLILVLFFIARYKIAKPTDRKSAKSEIDENVNEIDPKTQQEQPKSSEISYRKTKLALCGLCLAFYATCEVGYFPYCSSMWQYMDIKLSAAEAARVNSIFSVAYTLAPIATAFISMKIAPDLILSYHFGLILTGVSVLYLGRFNKPLIYTGNVILGYGFAPMIPALTAFTERHLKLDDRVASFFYFCTNFVGMVMPLVLGRYLQTFPLIMLYLLGSLTVSSLTVFVIVRLWIFLDK